MTMKQTSFPKKGTQSGDHKRKYGNALSGAVKPPHITEENMQWYFRKSVIIIAVCLAGPFALPLIWCRPQTTLALKIGLAAGILLVFILIVLPGSGMLFFG
jgi:hypothetical protein